MTRIAALDLGTTRIKAGLLDDDGQWTGMDSRAAPPPAGPRPEIRETPAGEYLHAASAALETLLRQAGTAVSLGLASQRSSFVLWDGRSGVPATPLISWQDRRAADWCDRHREHEPRVIRLTGLPLSPHYAGPKLAALIEQRDDLREGLNAGTLIFGTLETYLVWHWSAGRAHETDLTMAARTLMADPRAGGWSAPMLRLFGVPPGALPRIGPTAGRATALDRGSRLGAAIADQAAGTLAALGDSPDSALVNLGTGGFVLRPTGREMHSRSGYLSGPILGRGSGQNLYALEGTINGAGIAADRFGRGPTELPVNDPAPEAFCLPDVAGIGSPHWRPDRTLAFSAAAAGLPEEAKRRLVVEGILFRVREILDALFEERVPVRVCLAGGLSRDPAVAAGLAACLARPVELLDDVEGTLLGVAALAAGRPPASAKVGARRIMPAARGAYLADKYPRWRVWLERLLQT